MIRSGDGRPKVISPGHLTYLSKISHVRGNLDRETVGIAEKTSEIMASGGRDGRLRGRGNNDVTPLEKVVPLDLIHAHDAPLSEAQLRPLVISSVDGNNRKKPAPAGFC